MAATEPGDDVVVRNVLYVLVHVQPAGSSNVFTLRLDPDDGSRWQVVGPMLRPNSKLRLIRPPVEENRRSRMAQTHMRDGKPVPAVEECVEAFHGLGEGEFRHVIEEILGLPRQRFKGGAHYVFSPATTEVADRLCAYLRDRGIAYDRETTRRWSPKKGGSG
jgi:hypothetical protein